MARKVTWLLKKDRRCENCEAAFPKGSSVGKFLRHVQSCGVTKPTPAGSWSLKLSSRKHIPLIVIDGEEFYPWRFAIQFAKILYVLHEQLQRRSIYRGARFSYYYWWLIHREYEYWARDYMPKTQLPADPLILDAGAGQGETVIMFARKGFHRFKTVELEPENTARMLWNFIGRDVDVEARTGAFQLSDLDGVDFAKVDVDGGESVLLGLERVPCEIVVEVHGDSLFQRFMSRFPSMMVERTGGHNWTVRLIPSAYDP